MSTSEVLGILTGLRQGWPRGPCISPCQPVAQLQSGSPQERIGTSTTAATASPLRNNDSMGHFFSKFILNDLHPYFFKLRGCYSYCLKFQKLWKTWKYGIRWYPIPPYSIHGLSITVAPHSGSYFGTPVLTHGAVHQSSALRAAVEALLADVVGLRLDQGWYVSLSTVQLVKPLFGESIGNVAISTGHKGTTKFWCFSVFLFQNIPCSQIH